jgi:hypothetical protein
MKAYKFKYLGETETAIIANNSTYQGSERYVIVLLTGDKQIIFGSNSITNCLNYMKEKEEITIII